jgi:alkanesulfonate monooxygenase SsuD/methylene tetrahydromethanopterin reductase-like flavin-dependent oxidoreductase (luciferase family)
VLPKPVQRGGIPVWIGGHTGAAVRRAGAIGDGWHPIGMRPPAMLGPEEYAAKVEELRASARRAGRDPKLITLTIRVPMEVRSKNTKAAAGDRPPFQGTGRGNRRRHPPLPGARRLALRLRPHVQELRAVLANMERFANDVRPMLARAGGARGGAAGRAKAATKKKASRRRG